MLSFRLVTALVACAAGAVFLACDSQGARAPAYDPCHPVPPAHCDHDVDCAPFLCKSQLCATACKSSATCAQGFVCNPGGACVKPATCGTCSGDYDCPKGQKCDFKTSACQ